MKRGKSAANDQPVADSGSYVFGPFRLNGDTRELRRGHDVVAMTPKAFDTLRVLVTFNSRVVEKDELLRLVWPDTASETKPLRRTSPLSEEPWATTRTTPSTSRPCRGTAPCS